MKKTTKTTARKPVAKKAQPKSEATKVAATKPSRFSGMKLFPTAKAKKSNPRRPTAKQRNGKVHPAFGFTSLEIIRKSPGISYEEFIRAGGRRVDLAWDVLHGNAEAKA